MMMKSSCPLLLLGTACLFLLVQEGHGLNCYVGDGLTVTGKNVEEVVDCSNLEGDKAKYVHEDSCKKDDGETDERPRDHCVTWTSAVEGKPNQAYNKYCGCGKGLTDENTKEECDQLVTITRTCACKTNLCNDQYRSEASQSSNAPPTSSTQDNQLYDGPGSDATLAIPALSLVMTSALAMAFYWTLV